MKYLIKLFSGVKRLIEHFHNHHIPIGLATSSSKESYELKVNKHHQDLFSLFSNKTFGSSDPEVKRGKPHPDIFLVAASRFSDTPDPKQVQTVLLRHCILFCKIEYLHG